MRQHRIIDLASLQILIEAKIEVIPHKAPGMLKAEMRGLRSLILQCAEKAAVPAGSSLAVDRHLFAEQVTSAINNHPNITLIREEATTIPDTPTVIATGPLTSDALAREIAALTDRTHLYFYDYAFVFLRKCYAYF